MCVCMVICSSCSVHTDTTIAELIKNVTDKRYFLEQLYTEQSKL